MCIVAISPSHGMRDGVVVDGPGNPWEGLDSEDRSTFFCFACSFRLFPLIPKSRVKFILGWLCSHSLRISTVTESSQDLDQLQYPHWLAPLYPVLRFGGRLEVAVWSWQSDRMCMSFLVHCHLLSASTRCCLDWLWKSLLGGRGCDVVSFEPEPVLC